jgi:hypothetical protein
VQLQAVAPSGLPSKAQLAAPQWQTPVSTFNETA